MTISHSNNFCRGKKHWWRLKLGDESIWENKLFAQSQTVFSEDTYWLQGKHANLYSSIKHSNLTTQGMRHVSIYHLIGHTEVTSSLLGYFAKNELSEFDHVKTSDRLKLKDFLQTNWMSFFKNIKVMKGDNV